MKGFFCKEENLFGKQGIKSMILTLIQNINKLKKLETTEKVDTQTQLTATQYKQVDPKFFHASKH